MRSTRVRSSARLVITAATCGICAMPAKVAPPLKSARTKFSVSDEWVTARPSTSVRRSSDLPEPVAPTHRPCGPMPSCAASFKSSMTGWPSSPTPIGTRRRSATERGRQVRETSTEAASPRLSSSVNSRFASSGSSSSPPVPIRSGASWRASASAASSRERVGDAVVDQAVSRLEFQRAGTYDHGQTAPRVLHVTAYDLDDCHALETLGRSQQGVRRHCRAVQYDQHVRLFKQRLARGVEAGPAVQP